MGVPLEVTEWMTGYVGRGVGDCDEGYIKGLVESSPFSHQVVIRIDDIDRFIVDPKHEARMDGRIECPVLGGERSFDGGMFNMLLDTKNQGLKVMLYRMPVVDANGVRYTVLGHKTIRSDSALDLLNDIMRLSISIYEGDVAGPDVTTNVLGAANVPAVAKAKGIIHIRTWDGLRSGASFASPGASPADGVAAVGKFGRFYLGKLWDVYAKAVYSSPTAR